MEILNNLSIRAYVRDEEDAQEELATLFEDIEKIIDENDALVYDTSIVPNGKTTSMTLIVLLLMKE